jgi:hypothetical protein
MQFLDHVCDVWAESYLVGCMDWCSLTAVIYPSLGWGLTAPSISHMTSLTETLLGNFVLNVGFALSFNHNRQHHIQFVVWQSTWFGVWNICMARTTLVHTLTYNSIWPFGHRILKKLTPNTVGINCDNWRDTVNNTFWAIQCCSDAGAITMSLSEYYFYIVISSGSYLQG